MDGGTPSRVQDSRHGTKEVSYGESGDRGQVHLDGHTGRQGEEESGDGKNRENTTHNICSCGHITERQGNGGNCLKLQCELTSRPDSSSIAKPLDLPFYLLGEGNHTMIKMEENDLGCPSLVSLPV